MRHLLRSAVALLLLSLPSHLVVASSPAQIQGRITDADTGKAIPSVQVIVVWTQHMGITDNLGSYTISGVSAGTVQVGTARTGYQGQKQTVTVPDTGVLTVNFELKRLVPKK
jgi:hypothetical protein